MGKVVSELEKKIQRAVKGFVFRRRIWDKAYAILTDKEILKWFGSEERHEKSCYMTHTANCKIEFATDQKLALVINSYGQFHENYNLSIYWNGHEVFEGNLTHWLENIDSRRIAWKRDGVGLVLEKLDTGEDWADHLSVKRIKGLIKRKQKETERRRKAEQRTATQPPREPDEDVADSLGVPRAH